MFALESKFVANFISSSKKALKFFSIGIFACLFYCIFISFEAQKLYCQERNFLVLQDEKKSLSANEKSAGENLPSYFSLLKFVPDLPGAKENVLQWSKNHSYEPNYILENVYRFSTKDGNGTSLVQKTRQAEFEKLNLLVRSFSKMEGLKYYSNTRHKMDVLYHKCYTIGSVETKNRIDDITDFSINPIYVLFDDNSFGEYIGQMIYGQTDKEIHITQINQNSLGLPGMKVIKPYDMTAFIDIIPLEKDEIEVYVLIEAKANVTQMFKNMIYQSFIARSDAIFNWIKDSY